MSYNDVMLCMSAVCAFAIFMLLFADKPSQLGAKTEDSGAH